MRKLQIAVLAIAIAGTGAIAGAAVERGSQPAVRTPLAGSDHPRGAEDRVFGLSRVVIPPGTELALHHHQGTQVARIARGTLTYTVDRGGVRVRSGPYDDHPALVRTIAAGETGRIHPGEWIVEQPSTHHSAENRGDVPVVIYLANLLRDGAPPSTPG